MAASPSRDLIVYGASWQGAYISRLRSRPISSKKIEVKENIEINPIEFSQDESKVIGENGSSIILITLK